MRPKLSDIAASSPPTHGQGRSHFDRPSPSPPRLIDVGVDGTASHFGLRGDGQESTTLLTVLLALTANLLEAAAKSAAAVITRSASLTAEAAHSWADTGNQLFLVIANRRAARPADAEHPLGHGREAYVWSLIAAMGLFVAGGALSIWNGVDELRRPSPAANFAVGYAVLAFSFVLEASSFLRSAHQARSEAATLHRDLIEHVMATSDPTLRAVFFEDASALSGIVLATAALGVHQLTDSATPDAVGSIMIGVLLSAVAFRLINLNRRFLVGEEADPHIRAAVLRELLDLPEVTRVTYLRLEVVGPRMLSVVADVDLPGDEVESSVAVKLRALEARITASPAVAGTLLSLSAPDERSLSL